MQRSPLRLVVTSFDNPDPVMVHNIEAVVYRRAYKDPKSKVQPTDYWSPSGSYFVCVGLFKLPVAFTGNGFELRINTWRFLRLFLPQFPTMTQEQLRNVATSEPQEQAAQGQSRGR
jgi:hypothetical protein